MSEPTRESGEMTAEQPEPASGTTDATEVLVEQDLLVEDVSIDGMCGVY
jgi:mycofactocin precursor